MPATFEFLGKEALSKRKVYDEKTTDMMNKLADADWCFENIIGLFYNVEDDEDKDVGEEDEDEDVFADFCEHIKDVYQIFCESDEKDVLIRALKTFRKLVRIQEFSEWLVDERDLTIQRLADITVQAILDIYDSLRFNEQPDSTRIFLPVCDGNVKVLPVDKGNVTVWYDFDKDTPEMVYRRINE